MKPLAVLKSGFDSTKHLGGGSGNKTTKHSEWLHVTMSMVLLIVCAKQPSYYTSLKYSMKFLTSD